MNIFHKKLLIVLAGITISIGTYADGSLNELISTETSAVANVPALEIVIYPAKRVITMEKEKKEASAVSVSGKRILGVGTLEELKRQAGTRAFRIDETFKDKIVMPGFIDQHLHPVMGL